MFYHVAKGQKEKDEKKRRTARNSSDLENLSEMEPGLWGRNIHKDARARSRSPRPGSGSRSRSRGTTRDLALDGDYPFPDDDFVNGGDYHSDREYDDEEDEEAYIHVPKSMLGQPLKDFDSGQENVSFFIYFYLMSNVNRHSVFGIKQNPVSIR